MSKLEELRDLVAKAFEKAETKENIETLATINNKIDEVSHESEDLSKKNEELIVAYKDLVKHTSFQAPKINISDEITSQPVSFEQALENFMKN